MQPIMTQIGLEIKSLRLYGLQIIISLWVMPASYMMVIILGRPANGAVLAYELTGFVAASLAGSLLSLLSARVSNFMQPYVMELYATVPATPLEIVAGQTLSYAALTLPQVLVAMILAAHLAGVGWHRSAPVGGSVLLAIAVLGAGGICLGLLIRNPFVAQGVLPLMTWVLVLVSPAYYGVHAIPQWIRLVFAANPVTGVVTLLRWSVGMPTSFSPVHEAVYLGVLLVAMAGFTVLRLSRLYMLERLF